MAICPSGHKKYYGRSQYLLYEVYVSLVYPNRVLSYHEFTATSIPKKTFLLHLDKKNNTGTVSFLTDAGCCLRHMHPLTVSMLFTIYLTQTLCEERLFPIFYDSRIVNDVIKLSGNANNNADGKSFVNILSHCITLSSSSGSAVSTQDHNMSQQPPDH